MMSFVELWFWHSVAAVMYHLYEDPLSLNSWCQVWHEQLVIFIRGVEGREGGEEIDS